VAILVQLRFLFEVIQIFDSQPTGSLAKHVSEGILRMLLDNLSLRIVAIRLFCRLYLVSRIRWAGGRRQYKGSEQAMKLGGQVWECFDESCYTVLRTGGLFRWIGRRIWLV
jgi:hypothetical protein